MNDEKPNPNTTFNRWALVELMGHRHAANLKSKNGDILIELERSEVECNQAIRRYRAEIEKQEAALRLVREMLSEAESRRENLRCRWNIWMSEHGDKLMEANDQGERRGHAAAGDMKTQPT